MMSTDSSNTIKGMCLYERFDMTNQITIGALNFENATHQNGKVIATNKVNYLLGKSQQQPSRNTIKIKRLFRYIQFICP